MAEIIRITSEALQSTIRRLLPSQNGFGDDLMATSVITPIIDLTPSAEGSVLPSELQNALAFGSQTPFDVANETATIINNTGFYRVFGAGVIYSVDSRNVAFNLTDGLSSKTIWKMVNVSESNVALQFQYDFVVFIASGQSLTCTATVSENTVGSTRQIADINGVLVDPSGYSPE